MVCAPHPGRPCCGRSPLHCRPVAASVCSCVTKLAYLSGRGLRGASLAEAMRTSLRGELTDVVSGPFAQGLGDGTRLDAELRL